MQSLALVSSILGRNFLIAVLGLQTRVTFQTHKSHARQEVSKLNTKEYLREWRRLHPESVRKSTAKGIATLREQIFLHYGIVCACCGYDKFNVKFRGRTLLEIDHISGGGRQELKRLKIGSGTAFYSYLRKRGFPPGYRVLCRACNSVMQPGEVVCELHKWERQICRI